jgi:RNA polymerase sigma-70 factor (ECF subfamily)
VVGRPRDLDSYDQLVREHQGIAFRTAYVITGSAADAEEVVQDAFVKAYRARGRFRSGAPFRPWLLAIVANEARNRRRASARRARLPLELAEERPSGGAAPSPEVALLAREERASCSPRSTGWGRSSARRSRAATSSGCRRRRRRPCSAAGRGP